MEALQLESVSRAVGDKWDCLQGAPHVVVHPICWRLRGKTQLANGRPIEFDVRQSI
jgi:hypothetical protein